MRKFLNENWFKLGVLILGFMALAVFFYLQAKKHNLEVVNSMRLCANLYEIVIDDAVGDCSHAVGRQKIPLFWIQK